MTKELTLHSPAPFRREGPSGRRILDRDGRPVLIQMPSGREVFCAKYDGAGPPTDAMRIPWRANLSLLLMAPVVLEKAELVLSLAAGPRPPDNPDLFFAALGELAAACNQARRPAEPPPDLPAAA